MPLSRALTLLFLATLAAGEESQIEWVSTWERAFEIAKEQNRPVMLCINSKDKESANERAARETYHDADFVAESRKFVMLVLSTLSHRASGVCPRFGIVTCEEHLACWKALAAAHGEQFSSSAAKGEMISPQHAWFRPDGTLLRRREYEMTKAELLDAMRAVLAELSGGAGAGTDVPGAPTGRDAPLSEKDLAEIERARTATDAESRAAALGNVLSTGKIAAVAALVDLLQKGKSDLHCAILRAFGKAGALDARFAVEDALRDKDEIVRSFAAVALETMGRKESLEPLEKRAKTEKDTQARKNMYRAIGRCGGGVPDEAAAKVLLKAMEGDKQAALRKHSVIAMRSYEGPGAKFVLKPLEQAALKVKDPDMRGALVYTLAYIGNSETTVPVLQEVMAKLNDDLSRAFVQTAINICKGRGGDFGRAAWWIFAEDRNDPARQ